MKDARVIVMKVGLHLGEAWESIVPRKRAEERSAGVAYWGYGGTVCHPLRQVQPFADQSDTPVQVLMIRTRSDFDGTVPPAVEQTIDGRVWTSVPNGVVCTGSYALILHNLRPTDEDLDLGVYEVGIGPKQGTPLPLYLRSRVDKACARRAARPGDPQMSNVILRAELAPPYAVILR